MKLTATFSNDLNRITQVQNREVRKNRQDSQEVFFGVGSVI